MSRRVSSISQRLSLRAPQQRALEILDRVMVVAHPRRTADMAAALAAIRAEYPEVTDFERSFPSLCFALATGVGKTRLMGAFITYLFLEHGIRHFFVLAPNLTIYEKLVTDFTPNTPKYVFAGVAEFAVKAPALVTGDNFETRPQQLHLGERDDVVVNVFNIAKFNVRSNDARKIRRLSEYLGQSYFDYLASLEDLVLIMDEAHRYRAETSMRSLEDLKPILGLELTATPQMEAGSRPTRFQNVVLDYPLAHAMRDGYVKEPAVATRADFKPGEMTGPQLERLKLEDGVRVHEVTKVELDVYARENEVRLVRPFMLVIASDTEHAGNLKKFLESDEFFDGTYRGRVLEVHSAQKGSEKDENVQKLLAVERPDSTVEIVVHVNMLKEGWDVTNLYTIVPLRTADSRTLVEQSIGRGLRLPYGQRTGVAAVDRLTIVAHDRFQEIVDEAKKGGFSFQIIRLGTDVPDKAQRTVVVPPVWESDLGIADRPTDAGPALGGAASGNRAVSAAATSAPGPRFTSPEQVAIARLAVEAIRRASREPGVPNPAALQSDDVQARLAAEITQKLRQGQLGLFASATDEDVPLVLREVTTRFISQVIAIPRVLIVPCGDVRAGFHRFELDLTAVRYSPVEEKILIRHLASEGGGSIDATGVDIVEQRPEDYVVRALIDLDDVSYDDHAALLYDLAGQVVAHLRRYLKDDQKVRNVLVFHQKAIASLVHAQMRDHAWEEASSYEPVVNQGFIEVRHQAYVAAADESVRRFDVPVDNKIDIRKMLFGGFRKCIYPTQKFDSDPERRLAAVLERDDTVRRWLKPAKNTFRLPFGRDGIYEPDFVAETKTEKVILEPKRADQLEDPVVLAKARAAATWCGHASAHEMKHGGKPWRYVLIPHDAIGDNATLGGLLERFTFEAPSSDGSASSTAKTRFTKTPGGGA